MLTSIFATIVIIDPFFCMKKKKKRRGRRLPKSSSTRTGRLQLARKWIKNYEGKNIIKGYANWFRVDKICAVVELRMLGIEISPEREKQIRDAIEKLARDRKRAKERRAEKIQSCFEFDFEYGFEYDCGFELFFGTTSSDAPFDIPSEDTYENDEDRDLPF